MGRVRYTTLLGLAIFCCLMNYCDCGKIRQQCFESLRQDHDLWCPATATPYCASPKMPCESCAVAPRTLWGKTLPKSFCQERLQRSQIDKVTKKAPMATTRCDRDTGKCVAEVRVHCSGFLYANGKGSREGIPGPELSIRLVGMNYRILTEFGQG